MASIAGTVLECGGETWEISSTLLGKGGFATVFRATGSRKQSAAVKVIDLREQSLWAQAKLRSEGDNLLRAQYHDNIVRFHGELRHGPYHIFVLEEFGQDLLDQVIEQRGLKEARSVGVVEQLMRALAWLHSKRICHGDVKPENLLCEHRDGVDVVKLADFGSAVQLPPHGTAAVDPVAQGTTLYSPPEVLQGHAFSCAADMWAAGITTCAARRAPTSHAHAPVSCQPRPARTHAVARAACAHPTPPPRRQHSDDGG